MLTASRVGRGSKCSSVRSRLAVEPVIFEADVGGAEQLARAGAAARPLFAAHLEQIGEIVVEQQRQVEARAAVAMVLHADALIGGAAPQEHRAHDWIMSFCSTMRSLAIDVRIGEIDRQRGIVVAQIRAQQQRLRRPAPVRAAPDSAYRH